MADLSGDKSTSDQEAVELRKSVRDRKPSDKCSDNIFQDKVKGLWDIVIQQTVLNKKAEQKVKTQSCDVELLQTITNSLKLLKNAYADLREHPMFKPEQHHDLVIAIDRSNQDHQTLSDHIERQLATSNDEDMTGGDPPSATSAASNSNVEVKNVEVSDRASVHSFRSGSNKSSVHKSASLVSSKSGSNRTSASAARLREAAAIAQAKKLELEALLLANEEDEEVRIMEQQLETRKRQAKQKKLQLELEAQEKKTRVFETAAVDAESGNSMLLQLPNMYRTPLRQHLDFGESPRTVNAEVREPTPHVTTPRSAGSSSSDIQVLVEALTRSMRTPLTEPSVFSGDPLKYNVWRNSFDALIAEHAFTDQEKLSHLRKYVAAPVRDVISGFFEYNGDDNYAQARKVLDERYGDRLIIMKAYRKRLSGWPKINSKDGDHLMRFGDALRQCECAMKSIPELRRMDDYTEIELLVQKIPERLIDKWSSIVVATEERSGQYPDFSKFTSFVAQQAKILRASCRSTTSSSTTPQEKPHSSNPKRALNTTTQRPPDGNKTVQCLFCKMDNHSTVKCYFLGKKSDSEKTRFVYENRLCFSCLKPGHMAKDCKNNSTCTKCSGRHPTNMHLLKTEQPANKESPKKKPTSQPATDSVTVEKTVCHTADRETPGLTSMIMPVWVSTSTSPQEVMTYALLDTQSDTTFVTNNLAEQMKIPHKRATLKLSTMTSDCEELTCNMYTDLQIRGFTSDKIVKIQEAYSRDHIPVNKAHIPTPETAEHWQHLLPVKSKIPERQDCEIGMLIGYDCPAALAPVNSVTGEDDEPFAVETKLGWTIVGGNGKVHENSGGTAHNITNLDDEDKVSQDDLKFLDIISTNIKQDPDGYYSMPLPFKGTPSLTKTRPMAEKRLGLLKNKFQKDPTYYKEYKDFMEDIISKGHAEVAPDQPEDPLRVNYIPHFGVRHPKKRKLRVVFDASAKNQGVSLNDHLLQGPDQLNKLTGVLSRFRKEPIAIMCDIEQMFHSFKVDRQDRDYLRFLWFTDDSLSTVKEYRMTVHLFGATSSPGCATFGLRQAATDHHNPNDPTSKRASQFICHDFYVDDGLLSLATEDEAITVLQEAKGICLKGNIRLHKFLSNSKAVMSELPASELAKTTQTLDLAKDPLPIERALGVEWCLENDLFRFRVNLPNKPATRRGLLSTIASVFDPLGFLAPFVLVGKNILQELCRNGSGWDDELDETTKAKWLKWLADLKELEDIQIQRCVVPPDFGVVKERSLHHFSDASQDGYGQCSYLRSVNEDGKVHCSFLFGKARVTPMQMPTIPRAELQAAVISVEVSRYLAKELRYENIEQHFWTDSKVVLGYINNSSRRFHVYVANRVHKIRESSDTNQWHYVSTKENPADLASRGLTASEVQQSMWFTGPDFLWENTLEFSSPPADCLDVNPRDPEIRNVLATTQDHPSWLMSKIEHYSSWNKAVGVATCLLKATKTVRKRKFNETSVRKEAADLLIRECQQQSFPVDIQQIKNNRLDKRSPLYNLDPYVDSDGILRVGGRLRRADIEPNERNPAVLPKQGHLTTLIIRHYHQRVAHGGKGLTMNKIRENGYWVVNCAAAVSSLIRSCVICARLRGFCQTQKMADLPQVRTEPTPPFTSIGCDCFGPFNIKQGRAQVKKYGLLCTCMVSRAVHIEVLDDLSTDSFVNALRRLIAIRGPVKRIFCDQGTNFIGANTEFKKALETTKEPLRSYLTEQQCEFHFNTPSASHMGGVWERQIRTAREVLSGALKDMHHSLNRSGLHTLFCEVSSIMNSRPLTVETLNDPLGPVPITPNQLLTMKTDLVLPPPGDFSDPDEYGRKQWKKIQLVANRFWERWRLEYLSSLQPRQRWSAKSVNLEAGDIVVLADDNQLRGQWKLARVVKALPGDDQLVRKVELLMSDDTLDKRGKRQRKAVILQRPVHKVRLLLKSEKVANLP